MRWIVRGADKVTGEARTLTVDAELQTQVELIASRQGLLVESIDRVDNPTLGPVEASAKASTNPERPSIPEYRGLKAAAALLRISAVLLLLLAVIVTIAVAADSGGPSGSAASTAASLAYALGLAAAGVLYWGAGAACDALRDIARNSFRWNPG